MSSSLTKSFLFLLTAEIIFNLSNYVVQIAQGRILGVEGYGRVSIVVGFATMLTILIGRGIPTAMSKRVSECKGDPAKTATIARATAQLQLIVIIFTTVVFFLAAPLIARAFSDPTLTNLFRLAALLIPTFALSSFAVQYFNGLKNFSAMTLLKISRGIFRIICIVAGAWLYGIAGAIIGAVCAPLFVWVVSLALKRIYAVPTKEEKITQPYPWKDILSYAKLFMLFLFFYEFFVRTDIYLIKAIVHDDYQTGIYNAAMTLSLVPYYLFFVLTFILFPTVSQLVKEGNYERLKALLSQILTFLWLLLVPAVIFLGIYAKDIVALFYGTTFAQSAPLIPLLLGGSLFGTFFYVLASVFNGASKTLIPTAIAGSGIALIVTLNLYFLPRYGMQATALIFSLTTFLMGVASLICAQKLFQAHIRPRALIAAPLLSGIVGTIAYVLPHGKFLFLPIAIGLFLLYIGLLFATKLLDRTMFEMFFRKN